MARRLSNRKADRPAPPRSARRPSAASAKNPPDFRDSIRAKLSIALLYALALLSIRFALYSFVTIHFTLYSIVTMRFAPMRNHASRSPVPEAR